MNTEFVNAGKQLASLRRRIRKDCEMCGREIVALKQAKYCSNRCRQRAKYQRQKTAKEESRSTTNVY